VLAVWIVFGLGLAIALPAMVADEFFGVRGLPARPGRGRAPADWTVRSVRAVAYAMAGHELHHLADIRRQHRG
jgi:hypothetical protein